MDKKLNAADRGINNSLTDEQLDSVAGGKKKPKRTDLCPCCRNSHPEYQIGVADFTPPGATAAVSCPKLLCESTGKIYVRINFKCYDLDGNPLN